MTDPTRRPPILDKKAEAIFREACLVGGPAITKTLKNIRRKLRRHITQPDTHVHVYLVHAGTLDQDPIMKRVDFDVYVPNKEDREAMVAVFKAMAGTAPDTVTFTCHLPLCKYCKRPYGGHVDGKCLFEPTRYAHG